jgi:hypothetical protein
MRLFVSKYKDANLLDDYVFGESLRWLACIHQFLGGIQFAKEFAD